MESLKISVNNAIAVFRRVHRARGLDDGMTAAHRAVGLIRESDRLDAWSSLCEFEASVLEIEKVTPRVFTQIKLEDSDALESVEPRPILVNSVLRQGEVGLLIGAAKANKTWMAIDLALSICEGGNWMGAHECAAADVLYIDAESTREMLAERMKIVKVMRQRGLGKMSIMSMRGDSPPTLSEAIERIAQGIAQSNAQLCIIDTLSAYFPIADENDNAEATQIMSAVVRVAEEMQCAILIIHHTPKMTGTTRSVVDAAAGAGAFARRADSIIAVRQDEGENIVDIRTRSFREIDRFVVVYSSTMRPQAQAAENITPQVEKGGRQAQRRVHKLGKED